MAIFSGEEAQLAASIGGLTIGNPFLQERIDLERSILKSEFVPGQAVWSVDPALPGENPNVIAIGLLAESLAESARKRAKKGLLTDAKEKALYEGLALYVLYYRYEDPLYQNITQPRAGTHGPDFKDLFDKFARDYRRFFELSGASILAESPAELFAFFFQYRRGFHFTFRHIYGSSLPAARLRAQVWESIFTHDIQRYRDVLFDRMHEITTLITGPSGTGKELVAQAIGLSRHIPFDASKKNFVEDFRKPFLPLNLCALSPTLLESELFGHKKGAFTGAIADRKGFLDQEKPWFTVFLDEFGEIDAGLQLKLLRVMQTRVFQRLGENATRRFGGKIVAATNVNLADEIEAKRFRPDLYYRMCSDVIEMPSLREQLQDQPDELQSLVVLVARRLIGGAHADALAQQTTDWITHELADDYPWSGNMRELEQCVRNVLVRKKYHPQSANSKSESASGPESSFADQVLSGALSADKVLARYCALIYAREGSYEASARRLRMDRRTVKSKLDRDFLNQLRTRS